LVAEVHVNAGHSVRHPLGLGVVEEHVLGLSGLHGADIGLRVVHNLAAELHLVSFDAVSIEAHKSIHIVLQLVLTDVEEGRAGVDVVANHPGWDSAF